MPVNLNTLGLEALRVSQRSLATTSHNIANVATPGFSRQQVDLTSGLPIYEGGMHFGQGVRVENVRRVFDGVLNDQIELQRSNHAHAGEFYSLTQRIDRLLSDPDTGLNQPLQHFFNELDGFTTNPGDAVQGQLLLEGANGLASKFNDLYQTLDSTARETNTRVFDLVDEVNGLASSIAGINARLLESPSGVPSNDMLDQRDEYLRDLSDLVSITSVTQDDGPMNVYLKGGHALVVGSIQSPLETGLNPFDPSRVEVTNSAGSVLSQDISGGRLGGLVEFRTEVLDPTFNALGRLAIGLAHSFNDQHRLGLDQQGNLGQDFFSTVSPRVVGNSNNTGTGVVSGTIANVADLTLSDYVLTYDGSDNYTLTRESDGATFAINTGGASPYTSTEIDGFTLDITAGAAIGDRFKVSPAAAGAQDISLVLSSTSLIASALPVRGEVAFSNLGTAELRVDAIHSTANLPLNGAPVSGDITLTYDEATNVYNLSVDPYGEGPLSFDPATDSNGVTFALLGGDLEITLSGQPRDGDQLVLTHNTGASGDNANAIRLLELGTTALLEGGSETLNQAMASQVASIGSQARDAARSEATFGAMLEQASAAREQIAGVNLDEEAANLLRFQQSYQAAAEILRVSESLFQTLIGVVQR